MQNANSSKDEIFQTDDPTSSRGYKYWICTWFNYPQDWLLKLSSVKTPPVYIAGQEEICPETQRHHVQFLLCYKDGVSLTAIRKRYVNHPEIRFYGKSPSAYQNLIAYVQKTESSIQGSFREWGKAPKIEAIESANFKDTLDKCKQGKWKECSAEHQVKYYGNLLKLSASYTTSHNRDEVRGMWIFGESGAGKSFYSRTTWPDAYEKNLSKWWDLYEGQKTIILEDLDHKGECLSHYLKIWGDHYTFKAEIKGGFLMPDYDRFIITSQYRPEEIWPGEGHSKLREAIYRRYPIYLVQGKFPEFRIIKESEINNDSSYILGLSSFISK